MREHLLRDFLLSVEARLEEHTLSHRLATATKLIAQSRDRHALATAIRNVGEYLKATANLLEKVESRYATGAARRVLHPLARVVELGIWDDLFLAYMSELDKEYEKEWVAHTYGGVLTEAKTYLEKARKLVGMVER